MKILKKKIFLLIFVTIIIFITIIGSFRNNFKFNAISNIVYTSVYPFQSGVFYFEKKIKNIFVYFKDIKELNKNNIELQTKIQFYEKENQEIKIYKEKNQELRSMLDIKNQLINFKMYGANIIGKDTGNWFYIFTIDIGNKDKIRNQFPVITNKGLVGRIDKVTEYSSKVISILDDGSSVSARISRTRELGVVKGDLLLKNQGFCKLDYIESDIDIVVGDSVETSGIGNVFPKGIVIGKVKKIKKSNNGLSRYAIIEPYVDFKKLEEVFVIEFNKNNNTGEDNS